MVHWISTGELQMGKAHVYKCIILYLRYVSNIESVLSIHLLKNCHKQLILKRLKDSTIDVTIQSQ